MRFWHSSAVVALLTAEAARDRVRTPLAHDPVMLVWWATRVECAMAQRLLRLHPLRAADALQLAAAVVAAEHEPRCLDFVCLDDRLAAAASREGFRLTPAS